MLIHVTNADDNNVSSLASIMDSLRNKSSKAAVKEQEIGISEAIQSIIRFMHVDNTLDSQIDPFPADEILRRARSRVRFHKYKYRNQFQLMNFRLGRGIIT